MHTNFIVKLSGDPIINEDLKAVVRSIIEEYNKIFVASPPAGIRPIIIQYHSAAWPLTDSTTNSSTYYVFLTVNDRYTIKSYINWRTNYVIYSLTHEDQIGLQNVVANWLLFCCWIRCQ